MSGDALTVQVVTESVDPESDPITYAFAWYVDDEIADDYASDAVPAGVTAKLESWRVVVTPSDGQLDGPAAEATVTIGNSPPVAEVSLSPASVDTKGMLTATVDAGDPDGDEVETTLAWYVNGAQVDGATEDSLDGVLYFDRDDSVVAEVTVSDGSGGVVVVTSDPVVVGNSLPGDPVVVISPPVPSVYADVVCEIFTRAPDADGDVVLYDFAWTVDGAPFTDATRTRFPGDTVPSEATEIDQEWECTATAYDDLSHGGSASASAIISAWPGALEFSSCGATGASGPSQADCDDAYAGSLLEGFVTVKGGIQAWEVPATTDYVITAYGGQGAGAATTNDGGKGAWVEGTVRLTEGEIIYIAVGQLGTGEDSNQCGGGGGGTWVMASDDSPILIAGGGAGTRTSAAMDGCGGRADEYGGTGVLSSTSSCAGKSSSLGEGGARSSSSYGAGGGGYNSNGTADYGTGGSSWYNGLGGGTGGSYSADGGFGGGGSGNGSYGGGGGGGYSGGDGAFMAGGGGSYNSGDPADWEEGVNEGDGSVVIDLAF